MNSFAAEVCAQPDGKQRSRLRTRRPRRDTPRLRFEALEARLLLSASPMPSAAPKGSATTASTMCSGYTTYQVGESSYSVADQMNEILTAIQGQHSGSNAISRVVNIGSTAQGRQLSAIEISDNINTKVDESDEPAVAFVSTMHGNEPDGTILNLKLIDDLLAGYSSPDSRQRQLIDNTDIWILPLMNPDGLAGCTRSNALGYDLNRAFPDLSADTSQATNMLATPLTESDLNAIAAKAPEAAAVMRWSVRENFTLAANFHENGGVTVVNYPYDKTQGVKSGDYAKSPDDDLFKYISKVYSSHDPQMWGETKKNLGVSNPAGRALTVNKTFPYGITNGSDWFAATGTMQDWHYRYGGTNEVTIEVRDQPDITTVDALYGANRDSMMAYLQTAHIGVTGTVTVTGSNNKALLASIAISGTGTDSKGTPITIGNHLVFSDPNDGGFFRMLPPGTYNLSVTVSAPGFQTQTWTASNVVIQDPGSVAVPPGPLPALPQLVGLGSIKLTTTSSAALVSTMPPTNVAASNEPSPNSATGRPSPLTSGISGVPSTGDIPRFVSTPPTSTQSPASKKLLPKPTTLEEATDMALMGGDWRPRI